MARMVFSEVVGTMSFLRPQCDDDSVDRLHYYYTPTFLLVVAVLISLKMFGGSPIECWLPAEFKPSWQEYTELICWSMSTFFVRDTLRPDGSPDPREADRSQTVAYYQWTPFFLIFSAMLFYSPCVVWRKASARSGLVLSEVVGFAMAVDQCPTVSNMQARLAKLRGISAHLSAAFRHRLRRSGNTSLWQFWVEEARYHEAYLASLYMAIKLLFLAIVLLQACLMNRFLQTDTYDFYGWGVLRDLLQGRAWRDSGNFPRITFCDIDVRIFGSVQKYTVQCILVINVFTEKVFVLLWAWYSLLLLITLLNGLGWLLASVPFEARKDFVVRRLRLADMNLEVEKRQIQIEKFVREFLRLDGCFVLRMLDVHTGEWVCAEILDLIWEEFLADNGQQQNRNSNNKTQQAKEANQQVDGQQPAEKIVPGRSATKMSLVRKRSSKKIGMLRPLTLARPSVVEEAESLLAWASLPNLWTTGGGGDGYFSHQQQTAAQCQDEFYLPSDSSRQQSKMPIIRQTPKRHRLGPAVRSFDQPLAMASRERRILLDSPLTRAGYSAVSHSPQSPAADKNESDEEQEVDTSNGKEQ